MSYWFWTPEKLTREQIKRMAKEAREKGKRLNLDRMDLSYVDLSRVDLSETNLSGANLSRANLSEAGLLAAYLHSVILNGANLSQADLSQAFLFQANLTGANLRRAYFGEANLSEANLRNANLMNANLSRTNLREADLRGADLRGADLSRANLRDADLSQANLSRTNLSRANLSRTNLSQANLTGATLTQANLIQTKLDGTNFSEAIINRTYFIEVDLSQANGLTNTDHKSLSIIDINTIYQSKDKIPKVFLEKVGVHSDIIRWQHSLHTLPTVFICYSHKDEKEKNKLLVHLSGLERNDRLAVWHDGLIGVGTNWKEEIKQAISQASVALLLITPNFLTSDFILNEEVPELLNRSQNQKELVIFPIIARPCAWRQFDWLAEMQVRPKGGKPVWGTSRDIDSELTNITNEVIEVIQNLWLPKG